MPTSAHYNQRPTSEEERTYLESLVREDFERCHTGEKLSAKTALHVSQTSTER